MSQTNNKVHLIGAVHTGPTFSHETLGEKFYQFFLEIKRLSNVSDVLPVIVSERLIDITELKIGSLVEIQGTFRSYNETVDGKRRLILYVFCNEIEILEEYKPHINEIELQGYLCRVPSYRKTPLGKEISDMLIAIRRRYEISDYIPCIAWGRNAKFSEILEVGNQIKISGRIQSRDYTVGATGETRTCYEVSANIIETVEE